MDDNIDQMLNLPSEIEKISKFLKTSKNKFYSCHKLVEESKISKYQAMYILSAFVSQLRSFDDYVIVFEVEIENPDSTEKLLISSISPDFENVFSGPNVISAYVYAVCSKNENFDKADIFSLIPNQELIQRFNYELVRKERVIVSKKKPEPSKPAAKPQTKQNVNKPITKNDNKGRTKKEISSKANQKVINFAPTSNDEDVEETYYGGFNPNKEKVEKDLLKRKKDTTTKHISPFKNKKKYKVISSSVSGTSSVIEDINKSKKYTSENESESGKEEEKDEISAVERPPKKVEKVRRVKKTSTYLSETGYMVTKDEWVDEVYWSDEKSEKNEIKPQLLQPEPKKKKKGPPKNQFSLDSFFKK